jgi:hypothetical protein
MQASLVLQAALFEALEKSGLQVFDFPPESADYPFVMIGDDRQHGLDVKNGDYTSVCSTILVFSSYSGRLEVKRIMEQIRLACFDLKLTGYQILGVSVSDSFTALDKDSRVTQGVLSVNFKLIKGDESIERD